MASSWSGLGADPRGVGSNENPPNEKDPRSPIACRVCDQVFFDNRIFLTHFQSHFEKKVDLSGSSNSIPQFNLQKNKSLPTPIRICKSIANYKKRSWQNTCPSNNDVQHPIFAPKPIRASYYNPLGSSTRPGFVASAGAMSNPDTAGGATGATKYVPRKVRIREVEDPIYGFTKPYIKQLERPIQETIVIDDVSGGNEADEIDLTLKL